MTFCAPGPETVVAQLEARSGSEVPSGMNVPFEPVDATDSEFAVASSSVAPVPIVADPDAPVEVALGGGAFVFWLADVDTGGS